jgi:hypothetical protein
VRLASCNSDVSGIFQGRLKDVRKQPGDVVTRWTSWWQPRLRRERARDLEAIRKAITPGGLVDPGAANVR